MNIRFIIDGKIVDVVGEEGRSLLDIALIAGINPPYLCLEGHCGTCTARVNGQLVRTCQALPSSDTTVDYDKRPSL